MSGTFKTGGPLKRGSALIIVLGFLAVLILVVFAFAVRMQTEYRLARGFHGRVRAQHALFQALQLAMVQVCQRQSTVGDGATTVWYPIRDIIDGDAEALGRRVGPVLATNFLSPPADRYIPLAVYDAAVSAGTNQSLSLVPNRIERVRDFYRRCGDPYRWVARDFDPVGVSYLLINCSDYADINVPHPVGIERRFGTNVLEIRLEEPTDPLPRIDDGRAECGQVESLAELYAYRDRYGLTTNEAANFFVYSRNKLGEYIRTNSLYRTDSMVWPSCCLTGTVMSVITNSELVKRGFEHAGFYNDIDITRGYQYWCTNPAPAHWANTSITARVSAGELRGWLYTNLLDYVDGDTPPRPFNDSVLQPSQEPVPGLNEICVLTDFSVYIADSNRIEYTVKPSISFEAWNPYVTGLTNRYRMILPQVMFTNSVRLYPGTDSSNRVAVPWFGTIPSAPYLTLNNVLGPQTLKMLNGQVVFPSTTVSHTFSWPPPDPTSGNDDLIFPNGLNYTLSFAAPLTLRNQDIDAIVDQVGYPSSDRISFTLPITNAFDFPWGTSRVSLATFSSETGHTFRCTISNNMYTSFECVDPRFNWAIGTNRFGAVFWATNFNTETTGRVNQATIDWLTGAYGVENRTDYINLTGGPPLTSHTNHNYDMYCAGAALPGATLRTVGELGYLAVAPWRTIRLYPGSTETNQYIDRVLDTFTLVPTNRPSVRGMINPNTSHSNSLALVFNRCRLEAYPDEGGTAVPVVTSNLALRAAQKIVVFNYSGDPSPTGHGLVKLGPNVSDSGYGFGEIWKDTALTGALLPPEDDSEFRREALIRNSYGLFSTRNMCFTVFLLASAEIGYNPGGLGSDFSDLRNPTQPGGIFKAVAVVWRDAWTGEQIIQHFRYLPEDNELRHY